MSAPGPFAGKTALVTGGLGFIGSNLVRRLLAEGARVRVLDALTPGDGGNPFNLEGAAPREALSVTVGRADEKGAADAAVEGCDFVFHLAGKVSHVDSLAHPVDDLLDNAATTVVLLDACRRANRGARIVVAGTRQVYGNPLRLPVDETHPLRPPDYNGVSKIAAEFYARVAAERLGLSTSVLRLTNVYGPRQLVAHSRASFTGWLVRKAVKGETIELFGTGEQRRDVLYVDDAVEAFLLAATKVPANGEAWNCGREDSVSLREFATTLIRVAGAGDLRIVPFPPERKQIDIGDFSTDARRFREATGWRPAVSLEEGLRRTVAFFREHGGRYWEATP